MANITISDLHPAGFELFSDSQSYMTELSDVELNIQGGGTPTIAVASSEACGMAVVFAACALYDWLR